MIIYSDDKRLVDKRFVHTRVWFGSGLWFNEPFDVLSSPFPFFCKFYEFQFFWNPTNTYIFSTISRTKVYEPFFFLRKHSDRGSQPTNFPKVAVSLLLEIESDDFVFQ